VNWGTAAAITQAQIDAADVPAGFRPRLAASLPGAGTSISISDAANGGKTISSLRFLDVLPVVTASHAAMTVQPDTASGWVSPTLSDVTTDVDTVTFESTSGGLNSFDRIDMTCSQLTLPSSVCSGQMKFGRPGSGQTTTAPGVVVSWTDTKIVLRHSIFPGALLKAFTGRKGVATATYDLPKPAYFSPRITSVARTATPRQYQIAGGTFGRLAYMTVRLETGEVRRINKPGSAQANPAGVTVNGWAETLITVTDTALTGHSIENVTLYYTDTAGSSRAVAESNVRMYFLGSLTALISADAQTVTLTGEGLRP
jgi:hypothetical protein